VIGSEFNSMSMRIKSVSQAVAVAVLALAACESEPPDAREELIQEILMLAAKLDYTPLATPPPVRNELVRLGRMLAFDKILSGNRDIACMTCHLPGLGTGDARAIPVGEGGIGLGPARTHPHAARTLRHSPPLFNLHLTRKFLWDGRIEELITGDIRTPAGDHLTDHMESVFEFGVLSAQPLFQLA